MCSKSRGAKIDLETLRPVILKRFNERAKDYPNKPLVPVAKDVLQARKVLIQGVSVLLKVFPVLTCKTCPEVFIGSEGHLIQTCHGGSWRGDKRVHEWITGSINDILVPVEAYRLRKMSQGIVKHQQMFDYDRVPAVLELCCQAGAIRHEEILELSKTSENEHVFHEDHRVLSDGDLRYVATGTIRAWETVRAGVEKLLSACPSDVCKWCKEVYIGPNGHKTSLCGTSRPENLHHGVHRWREASVNDLVPQRHVWHRRPQDPSVLLHGGQDHYSRAPAVLSLCSHAGAVVPSKYVITMKPQGLSFPCHRS